MSPFDVIPGVLTDLLATTNAYISLCEDSSEALLTTDFPQTVYGGRNIPAKKHRNSLFQMNLKQTSRSTAMSAALWGWNSLPNQIKSIHKATKERWMKVQVQSWGLMSKWFMIRTEIKNSFFSQTAGGIDSVIYLAESFLSFPFLSEKPAEMTPNIPADTVQPAQTLHSTPPVPSRGRKVTADSFSESCLAGCVAQIRTKTITASNPYTTFSKWDMGKKSTSSRKYVVSPAVPEFWAPCRRLQLLPRAPVIILKRSYPPQHDAATHLCHMMINTSKGSHLSNVCKHAYTCRQSSSCDSRSICR